MGIVTACIAAQDNRTIVAGDGFGRLHFLRLVEADETKPCTGDTKIPLLLQEQQPVNKTEESNPMLPPSTRAVFISYAHADNESRNPKERWLDRFVEFLKPLVRQEDFTLCSDQDIKIGQNWHQHIQAHLNGAKVVVLLVSPTFLASDYIANSELPVILKNAADQGVRIFPILISPSLYKRAKYKYPDPKTGPQEFTLASIQAANPPSETLIEMTEGAQNRVLEKVADQLADLLSAKPRVGPSETSAPSAAGRELALSNLPDRNPFFTGREQVLAQLQEALAAQGRAALSGLGGVGKTQTAVEYAHRHLKSTSTPFGQPPIRTRLWSLVT